MPRRAPARVVAFTVAAALVTVAPRAFGKGSIQGTAEVAVGYTDNVFNAPYQDPCPPPKTAAECPNQNVIARYKDVLFELRPGIVFTTGAARAVQQLSYNFSADLFVKHPDGNSYNNVLAWSGLFLPSPRTELLLVLQSQEGRANTLTLQNAANGADLAITRVQSTSTTFFSQAASEALLFRMNSKWNFNEAVAFNAFVPIDPRTIADNYSTTADIGAERQFKIDAVGLNFRSQYIVFSSTTTPQTDPTTGVTTTVRTPTQHQLINQLIASWRRDWTRFWSTEAALGPLEASTLGGQSSGVQWTPYALAAVRYNRERGNGELRYEHNALPSPLSGSTYAIDAVTLRGAIPFPEKSRLTAAFSVGYQHGQLLLADPTLANATATGTTVPGSAQPRAEVLLADASINWQATTWLGVFARYEVNRQWGHASDGFTKLPDIFRNLVMVGVAGVYPTTAAAQVPKRRGQRVDSADAPAIPEPHSQPVAR